MREVILQSSCFLTGFLNPTLLQGAGPPLSEIQTGRCVKSGRKEQHFEVFNLFGLQDSSRDDFVAQFFRLLFRIGWKRSTDIEDVALSIVLERQLRFSIPDSPSAILLVLASLLTNHHTISRRDAHSPNRLLRRTWSGSARVSPIRSL